MNYGGVDWLNWIMTVSSDGLLLSLKQTFEVHKSCGISLPDKRLSSSQVKPFVTCSYFGKEGARLIPEFYHILSWMRSRKTWKRRTQITQKREHNTPQKSKVNMLADLYKIT